MGRSEMLSMDRDRETIKHKKGCFFTIPSLILLALVFLACLLATGLIVYYMKSSPQQPSEQKSEKVQDVRLPRNINPLHYDVRLKPMLYGNFSVDGHVEMTFNVLEDTRNVTLHINDIVTINDTIKIFSENQKKSPLKIHSHVHDPLRDFYVAHLSDVLEKGKNYMISMDFVGFLNKDLDGFYRSSYKDENNRTIYLAATQFSPNDARKAFPCMDEPALKATFSITLGRQANMSSISNMPLNQTIPMEGHPGWFWDKFEKSVKMSTYLVTFLVSDFENVTSVDDNKYEFRVWSRKSAISQTNYALEKGPIISKYFEDFFKVPFPLPKQDMIAVPDMSVNAMENWGAINYRETAILYDRNSTTARSKQFMAIVMAHELAHQWFGNLVTPDWWTELWLKEGFASYMEYLGSDFIEPTWKMLDQFVIIDLQPVFQLDCLESSHPINVPVNHPDEINEIFDKISYLKGSSIIRMMSHFLTEDTFRNGLSKYLTGLAYKNAVQDDLWDYLTKQAHSDGTLSRDMTVKMIMDTWTLQMGFPVLTVTNNKDGTATVKQERFLLLGNETSTSGHDYKWWIPLTFSSKIDPQFNKTKPSQWMNPMELMTTVNSIPTNGWVIFNNLQTGYYRVNYDQNNWDMISDQLLKDHTAIHPVNRAQLIDDSMNLARAGLLSYETAFKVLSYLKDETEYVPWTAALRSLGFIQSMFEQTGGYGALRQFLMSLILPSYKWLMILVDRSGVGFFDSVDDPHLDQMMRGLILSKACSLGHTDCLEKSVKLFESWQNSPDDYNLISPNLKPFVYCNAIKKGSHHDWKFAWERYESSNVGTEKRILLGALGCSSEPWILNGYLNKSITDGKGIRKQDARTVIASVAYSAAGKILAWEFLKDKWTDIKKYFGATLFTLNSIIDATTKSLNTESQIKQFKDFLSKHAGNFGSAERAAQQAFENAQNNLNWMNKNYDTILNWLNEQGYNSHI